jgi:hypothetical protein
VDRGWVYILKLENNRWYVGWTINPYKRMRQHFYKPGIRWVRENPPIDIAHQFFGTKQDERSATIQLAHVFGIANVRGGSHCVTDQAYKQENLRKPHALVIADEFWLDPVYDDRYLASQVSQQNISPIIG